MQFNNEKFPPVRGLYFFCDTCDTPLTYWVSRLILPFCSLWKRKKKKMDTRMISIPVSIFFKEAVLYSKFVNNLNYLVRTTLQRPIYLLQHEIRCRYDTNTVYNASESILRHFSAICDNLYI